MNKPFIIYLKNQKSQQFEYSRDVLEAVRTRNGYRITFRQNKIYNYGKGNVRYYPFLSTRRNVRIYQKGKLERAYDTVDNYGKYLIFRNKDDCSDPIANNADIEIVDIKENIKYAASVIHYFKSILRELDTVSFELPSNEAEKKHSTKINSERLLKGLESLDYGDPR